MAKTGPELSRKRQNLNGRHELMRAPRGGSAGRFRAGALAACGAAILAGAGFALAQDSDQQLRCMQLQQELAVAQGGGGNRAALPGIDRQIAEANRVYQGTKAAMEDAGCFERFLIFGQGLVRSPKCISMNNRAEDARRQLEQLQGQRAAVLGGGGNRRRIADLQAALARNGCGGAYQQQARQERSGGLFGWFGRGREAAPEMQQPVYRSIDPNGRYRSVCVRTCDGFFFPISYSTYAGRLAEDASMCQANCAAPAELYVYRTGGDIAQAISLNGTAYADLPNAFKYRTEYVKGCSCKQAEYNPTEIEAAGQKAGEAPAPGKQASAPVPAAPPEQLNLDAGDAGAPAPQEAPAAPEDASVTGALPAEAQAEPVPEAFAPPPVAQSSAAPRRAVPKLPSGGGH